MLDKAKEIKEEDLISLNQEFNSNRVNKALMTASNKCNLQDLVYVKEAKSLNPNYFSINIKTLPVANQKQSGRCWIFAGLNVLREIVAKKLNLDKFELSQNYIAYYDKIEKVNYALESIIDLLDKDYDDRTLKTILAYPVGDGGQWDMFKNLIKKYGVMPKMAMEETFSSSHTRESSILINRRIRKFAYQAKELHEQNKDNEVIELKNEVLKELYNLINISFGTPATKFDFEYVDKDQNYHIKKDLTPKEFYEKYVGIDIDNYVSIINAPTKDKPFHDTFTVDYIGNVIGGNPIKYLNLPMNEFKERVISQLKSGEVVWFGSDCSKFADRAGGLWAPEQYDYSILGIDVSFDKAAMLNYSESAMNHAMVITGVNLDGDKPNRWKIENSWGKDVAMDGYFTATDKWFNEAVFQAVVNKKYLTKEEQDELNKEPHHLNPWDPMGTLAD